MRPEKKYHKPVLRVIDPAALSAEEGGRERLLRVRALTEQAIEALENVPDTAEEVRRLHAAIRVVDAQLELLDRATEAGT